MEVGEVEVGEVELTKLFPAIPPFFGRRGTVEKDEIGRMSSNNKRSGDVFKRDTIWKVQKVGYNNRFPESYSCCLCFGFGIYRMRGTWTVK